MLQALPDCAYSYLPFCRHVRSLNEAIAATTTPPVGQLFHRCFGFDQLISADEL